MGMGMFSKPLYGKMHVLGIVAGLEVASRKTMPGAFLLLAS